MAVVYRAWDDRLGRRVALKLLSPDLASDIAFRTRFIRESRATVAVDHPNIIPVYDAGEADGSLFIAMRYVQGGDARSLLAEEAGLETGRAWKIIGQVAAALDAAHRHGLIHRDVKPANMLLENEHVYLSDFGISRLSVTSHLTTAGQLVGTLDYIAPESIKGQPIDGSVDQYSLACSAFELFTGKPPFHADLGLAILHAHTFAPPPRITRKRPDLPPAVDLVIAKAMAKNPADRYASCAEFSTDLGKALGEAPGTPAVGAAAGQRTAVPNAEPPRAYQATELTAHSGTALAANAGLEPAARPATKLAAPAVNPVTPPRQQQFLVPRQTPPPQQIPPPHHTPPPQYTPPPQQLYGQGAGPPADQWVPSAPNWPSPFPPPQPSRSQGTVVAIVTGSLAIAVAAVAAVLVVTNLNKPPIQVTTPIATPVQATTPGPAPATQTEATEAAAIENLIQASTNTFRPLQGLTVAVHNCDDLSYDYAQISRIANDRAGELATANDLNVEAIPDGTTLKSELIAALQTSEEADQSYVNWANAELAGCDPGSNYDSSFFGQAYQLDQQASTEKDTFDSDWASIATQYNYDANPSF